MKSRILLAISMMRLAKPSRVSQQGLKGMTAFAAAVLVGGCTISPPALKKSPCACDFMPLRESASEAKSNV